MSESDTPGVLGSSEGLGLLPAQKPGQALTMLRTGAGDCAEELGHWFSPVAVQLRIDWSVAAERERWMVACRAVGQQHATTGREMLRASHFSAAVAEVKLAAIHGPNV